MIDRRSLRATAANAVVEHVPVEAAVRHSMGCGHGPQTCALALDAMNSMLGQADPTRTTDGRREHRTFARQLTLVTWAAEAMQSAELSVCPSIRHLWLAVQ